MNIPFTAIATDILNEEIVVFDTGSFYDAIRASVAIPSLITPVKYRDTFLVDGGVLSHVPIDYVERTNNNILVVVNLYGKKKAKINPIKAEKNNNGYYSLFDDLLNSIGKLINTGDKNSLGYFSLLNTATHAMIHKLAKENIEKYQPDIIINLPFDIANTFDFHKADELIELGEKAATKEITKYLNSKK